MPPEQRTHLISLVVETEAYPSIEAMLTDAEDGADGNDVDDEDNGIDDDAEDELETQAFESMSMSVPVFWETKFLPPIRPASMGPAPVASTASPFSTSILFNIAIFSLGLMCQLALLVPLGALQRLTSVELPQLGAELRSAGTSLVPTGSESEVTEPVAQIAPVPAEAPQIVAAPVEAIAAGDKRTPTPSRVVSAPPPRAAASAVSALEGALLSNRRTNVMSASVRNEERMRGYKLARPAPTVDEMSAKLEELSRLQLEADQR